MNLVKKHLGGFASFLLFTILTCLAFAVVALAADPSPDADFVTKLFAYIQGFGGYAGLARVSGIIVLLIASMKVSFMQPLWAKLGGLQIWLAPILGFVGGLLASLASGSFSWAAVSAYALAGGGAVFLHEILDLVKVIPGLGPIWVSIISMVESIPWIGSGGSAPVAAQSVMSKK